MITVTAAPTGLTLIRGLNPRYNPTRLLASTADFAALEFDYFERNHEEFLRTIPNHRSAIQAFCQNTPVQSIVLSGVATPSR